MAWVLLVGLPASLSGKEKKKKKIGYWKFGDVPGKFLWFVIGPNA